MGLFYSTFKRVDFKTMIYKVIPFVVVAFIFFILFFILFFIALIIKLKKKHNIILITMTLQQQNTKII